MCLSRVASVGTAVGRAHCRHVRLTAARALPLRCAVDAFIALGGNADKTGNVQAEKLRGIVKEFGLTIDIDRLIREVDTDHSGLIDYQEFAVMMKS